MFFIKLKHQKSRCNATGLYLVLYKVNYQENLVIILYKVNQPKQGKEESWSFPFFLVENQKFLFFKNLAWTGCSARIYRILKVYLFKNICMTVLINLTRDTMLERCRSSVELLRTARCCRAHTRETSGQVSTEIKVCIKDVEIDNPDPTFPGKTVGPSQAITRSGYTFRSLCT